MYDDEENNSHIGNMNDEFQNLEEDYYARLVENEALNQHFYEDYNSYEHNYNKSEEKENQAEYPFVTLEDGGRLDLSEFLEPVEKDGSRNSGDSIQAVSEEMAQFKDEVEVMTQEKNEVDDFNIAHFTDDVEKKEQEQSEIEVDFNIEHFQQEENNHLKVREQDNVQVESLIEQPPLVEIVDIQNTTGQPVVEQITPKETYFEPPINKTESVLMTSILAINKINTKEEELKKITTETKKELTINKQAFKNEIKLDSNRRENKKSIKEINKSINRAYKMLDSENRDVAEITLLESKIKKLQIEKTKLELLTKKSDKYKDAKKKYAKSKSKLLKERIKATANKVAKAGLKMSNKVVKIIGERKGFEFDNAGRIINKNVIKATNNVKVNAEDISKVTNIKPQQASLNK